MARIPRILIKEETATYHVISRTALDGFPLKDLEKDYWVNLVKRLSILYFVEILGFCCMGNHFHLLIRMIPEKKISDKEIFDRFSAYYGDTKKIGEENLPHYRAKLSNLSEFMRELKTGFSRFYNKRHNRRGYFWGDRFKSVIVEDGQTLVNCLAYIDLNPVRAGIVRKPEDYRWNSIGYHIQAQNKDNLLSLDFGLKEFGVLDSDERLRRYRRFLYEKGGLTTEKGRSIDPAIVEKERKNEFRISPTDRFRYKTRYFSDSGIIGTKKFVSDTYRQVKHVFQSKREKIPKKISGLDGMYSLKRLVSA